MTDQEIVVGFDGSPGADHALRWAIGWAERVGGSIRAAMSWEYPSLAMLPAPFGGVPVPPPERMDDATMKVLRALLAPIRRGTDVAIAEVVREGRPGQVLVDQASDADLLVVGTRGRGRAASVLLGSVSRKVAAAAPCPVVVVPEAADLDTTGPVLVGVDGSSASLAALRWAGAMTTSPILALHVYEYPFGPEYAIDGFEWSNPEDLGNQVLERSVEVALSGRSDVTAEATEGDPREVLLERGQRASLIVVGARGAEGFAGAILGSVTTHVASRAEAPVVIVPGET